MAPVPPLRPGAGPIRWAAVRRVGRFPRPFDLTGGPAAERLTAEGVGVVAAVDSGLDRVASGGGTSRVGWASSVAGRARRVSSRAAVRPACC